jgi:predicted membrane-bound spermidine synthase
MGIGSYLSRYVGKGLVAKFIVIELLVGLIGGFSAAVLFLVFSFATSFRLILYSFVVLIGILVGLEIPLLLRILKDRLEFKDLVSQVLTFDYLGALLASLLFPVLLAQAQAGACLFSVWPAQRAGQPPGRLAFASNASVRLMQGQCATVILALSLGFACANR